MKKKELIKQTFMQRHPLAIIVLTFIVWITLMVATVTIESIWAALGIVVILTSGLILAPAIVCLRYAYKRDKEVAIFMGEDNYHVKFVKLAMKYLGHEVDQLQSDNDVVKKACLVVDDTLVYAARDLKLTTLDDVCKIANDKNIESVSIVMDRDDLYRVSSAAKGVAKRSNISIYDISQLNDAIYNAIRNKGGEPVRQCVCN